MIDRKDLGAWLEGPPVDEEYVPGSRLGLPAEGSGSVAPFGRRVLSLLIDWGLCLLVSQLAAKGDPMATLALFAAENIVLISLFGLTIGQFAMRLRVAPVSGRMPILVRAVLRTALLLLVAPGIIWNRDRQPLHDVAAATAVVRI
ncbi:RDD family protein [Brachybacterium sp. ACRRE]|uniref:RDD family protein n=1 Tax=Brachybacterium sp. ACRRE TaxID=2918184 RepID=UPI001EF2508F|nr:RDD family protein [Brachybacterium sp. ACRRE]